MPLPLPRRFASAPDASADPHVVRLLLDARRAYRGGPAAVAARQSARLADMVAFARSRSHYYRQLYAGLPDRIEDPSLLPVTKKRDLMVRFNEAVTDEGGDPGGGRGVRRRFQPDRTAFFWTATPWPPPPALRASGACSSSTSGPWL